MEAMSATHVDLASPAKFQGGGLAVVIGATGGLGAALVDYLSDSKAFAEVVALSRHGERPLDVTKEASVAASAAALATRAEPLRLVVVATGVLHDEDGLAPEKSWRDLDFDRLARAFAVNAIGPALVMKHFCPLLARNDKSVFAVLSARTGSIGDNRLGGWYGYRASKAALNQIMRTGAIELKRAAPQAVCVALHPGTVDTKLSRPFAKVGLDPQAPGVAAQRLFQVIEALREKDSGGFFDQTGAAIEW